MDDQNSCCSKDSSWLNEYLSSDHYNSYLLTCDIDFRSPPSDFDVDISLSSTDDDDCCYTLSAATDLQLVDDLPAFCRSNSPVRDIDPFFHKFSERMRFFDALYHERLYGMNAILDDHLTTPGLFTSTESSTDLSMQYIISCSRMAKKRLLRILECDFELIYVAQLCLFWEALHHQYQKVEALILSDISENRLFHHNVSGKFQEFQIQLERFGEYQKCDGQRDSNYTHKRLSFHGLLRVPDITGFMEENNSMGGEGIRASQVLKAIEKCIKAFWLYVKTDKKKSLWGYKGIWRTDPPVEDPQDLGLLYNVTKALHKKEIMLKDLQGKNKCWLRRKVKPLQAQEDEKINLVFAMMDMKLVQRLLKMPLISTSHLEWCQEKLNNLEFRQGNIFRGPTSHLFPSS
ncbi:hypothetical protein DH2020_012644 [Rehmannia glutinosa]|uniref:Uncharacterized protein n=1 Tax=Rehmannia glutinosa TaxID=99300 RepID=A0ABR0X0J9_REHGL